MVVLDDFIGASAQGSPHYMESPAREVRGRIRLARGDLLGGLADAERALELARDSGDPQNLYPGLAFRARALRPAGGGEEASATADELLALSPTLGETGEPNVKVDLA